MKNILTPYILQTIIICSTIISLAFIAVAAYREYIRSRNVMLACICSCPVLSCLLWL